MSDKIRRYVDRNDPDGVSEIPRLAQSMGRPVKEMLSQSERRKDELSRLRDRARYFSDSDGNWSYVRSELHDAANEIFDHWTRRYEETRRECEELSKEERSRVVEDALKRLTEGAQGRQILIKELNDEIAETVRLVTDVEADSSDSDVKSAERNAEDMKRILDRLRSAQGEDRRAKEIVEKWPRDVESMNNSLLALDELKDFQFTTDKAPERCQAEEEKIVRASENLERLNPLEGDASSLDRAGEELENALRQAREGLLEALRKAAEARRQVESLRDQAKGRWSASASELRQVDEEMDESADDVAKHFTAAHDKAQAVCAAPSSGPTHPRAIRSRRMTFGDCEKSKWRPLYDKVGELCKATSRRCEPSQSCDELRSNMGKYDACINARRTIIKECYSNSPDPGHQNKIQEEEKGRARCLEIMQEKKC